MSSPSLPPQSSPTSLSLPPQGLVRPPSYPSEPYRPKPLPDVGYYLPLLAGGAAFVVADNAPEAIKEAAAKAKRHYRTMLYMPNGTNDEVEIQAALDGNSNVLLSPGTFDIKAQLDVDARDYQKFRGMGRDTFLNCNFSNGGTGNIFNIDQASGTVIGVEIGNFRATNAGTAYLMRFGATVATTDLYIHDIWYEGTATTCLGFGFMTSACSKSRFERLSTKTMTVGWEFGKLTYSTMRDLYCEDVSDSVLELADACSYVTVDGVVANLAQNGNGIRIRHNGQGIVVANSHIYQAKFWAYAALIKTAADYNDVTFANCGAYDGGPATPAGGAGSATTLGGTRHNGDFVIWTDSASQKFWRVNFVNCVSRNADGNAFILSDCVDAKIEGGQVYRCGSDTGLAAARRAAVLVTTGIGGVAGVNPTRAQVKDLQMIDDQATPTMQYGVYVNSGTGAVIRADEIVGAGTASVYDTGTDTTGEWVERVVKKFGNDLFDAVGLTDSAAVWTQPANSILLAAYIILDTQFVATGLTDMDVTVGDAGNNAGILNATMDLQSDTVGTKYFTKGAYFDATAGGYYAAAATAWTAYTTATGANMSALTAGQITFVFRVQKL